MDPRERYDEETWNLMLSAFQGTLTAEEELRFNEWLGSSTANRELYEWMALVWKEGLADYPLYEQADERSAWEAMQLKMGAKPVFHIGRWMVAAAAIVLVALGGWWFFAQRDAMAVYATGPNETKNLTLPDGSTVVLHPQTKIERVTGYNTGARRLRLVSGTALFDVVHMADRPFSVEIDGAQVRDIGTRFTVEKTADSIRVAVDAGRIAFVPPKGGEIREVDAGGSISLYTAAPHAGELRETAGAVAGEDSLRFDNIPLAQILKTLEKQSGKKILLMDEASGEKRLTLHLRGESLENALQVICASTNLEYSVKAGDYVLAKRPR